MNASITRRHFLKSGIVAAVGTQMLRPIYGSQGAANTSPHLNDNSDWWLQKRFGMFIHWGLYSIHGWQEQEQWRRSMPRAEYVKLQQLWNPTNFNPDQWLDLAELTGMRYICITAKHHDGFCLWDTKYTSYNTMNTPYGKDIIKQLAEACHRRNFPLCIYYSIVDWHHPNYPNQGRDHELPPQAGDSPDWNKYLDFLKAQVRELCTNYGEIHGFWWDENVPEYKDPSINSMIRKLQPKIMINNRGFDDGDFGTPERDWDNSINSKKWFGTPVEACQSVGFQSWGYRVDEDYYTDAYLIRSIHKVMAKGGHYLLNVGPNSNGIIPAESAAILGRIGSWFNTVKESILNVEPANEFTDSQDMILTRQGNNLFVHLIKEPETVSVFIRLLISLPSRVTLLNSGELLASDLPYLPRFYNQSPAQCLRVKHLPINNRQTYGWVLKLEFDPFPTAVASTLEQQESK